MANTISEELNRLIQAKTNIRTALQEKCGLTIGDSSTLDEFPGLIQEMQTGGGGGSDTSTIIDLIEGDITSLVIPEGTTKIGDYAFYNHTNLQNVSIPNTVTSIGIHAFEGSGLSNKNNLDFLSDTSINSIDDYAFKNFNKLNDFKLPNTVTTVGSHAFEGTANNSSLVTVPIKRAIFHDNIEIIKSFALSNRPVQSIYLGRKVKTLEREALKNINSTGSYQNTYNQYWFNDNGLEIGDFVITAQTPPSVVYGGGGSLEGTFGSASYGTNPGWKKMYVPGNSLELYKTTYGWSNVSTLIQPLAAINYDEETLTVTAYGRDNLELYVDGTLINSSTYTLQDKNIYDVTVKSVDPSLGVLDEVNEQIETPGYTGGDPEPAPDPEPEPEEPELEQLAPPEITITPDSNGYTVKITNTDPRANLIQYSIGDPNESDVIEYTEPLLNIPEGTKIYAQARNAEGEYADSDWTSAVTGE